MMNAVNAVLSFLLRLLNRLDTWLDISERYNSTHPITPTTPTSFREIHGPGEFLPIHVFIVNLIHLERPKNTVFVASFTEKSFHQELLL
jgi:hypothetical protein